MTLAALRSRIDELSAAVGVVGLGYVGLAVACEFARARFRVHGVDIAADRVAQINARVCPIQGNEPGLQDLLCAMRDSGRLCASTDYQALRNADVVLVAVDTPVDEAHRPHYHALESCLASVAAVMKRGALVIVESTLAPGTADRLVKPLLEGRSGLRAGRDFYLGVCPERVMPGKLLNNLRTLSRVCGGCTPEVAETMVQLYGRVVQAELHAADMVTAELVKTAENAYRDVQIAFSNEVALICERNGADVWRVRELVNSSPFRAMHLPGAGVGGHCIPKDPWLLAHAAPDDLPLRLIPAARSINDGMPLHVADLTVELLADLGVPIHRSRVAVLGYAYLPDSDDTRNSPSEVLVSRLRALGADVSLHDPWVAAYARPLIDCAGGADAVVLMVEHDAYRHLDLNQLGAVMRTRGLVDGRNVINARAADAAGFRYVCLGRGAIGCFGTSDS